MDLPVKPRLVQHNLIREFDRYKGRARDMAVARAYESPTAAWLLRRAPRALIELPANVSPNDAKIYYTRLAVPICGAMLHVSLASAFAVLGVSSMVIVNIFSVLIFAVAAYVVRSGHHKTGTKISVMEVAIHLPLGSILLGLDAGYFYYNFIFAMAAALAYSNREWVSRIVVVGYAGLSSGVSAIVLRGADPILPLSMMQLQIVSWINASGTFVALVLFAYYFVTMTERAEQRVVEELKRSEQLLLNVLPAQVAARLKSSPGTISDSFASATVLFADIVGFSQIAATRSASDLVEMLNELFSAYDRIAEKYGLEKIKTIGDAYMVASGVPEAREDHAAAVVAMALEMVTVTRASRLGGRRTDDQRLDVRIGIHSGQLIAGVIGERKFAYDLWGDTVNLASRLESHGIPGLIQISNVTRDMLGDAFELRDRGMIELKGRAPERAWIVERWADDSANDPTDETTAA